MSRPLRGPAQTEREFHLFAADRLTRNNDWWKAGEHYEWLIQDKPDAAPQIYEAYATCLQMIGDMEGAVRNYRKALAIREYGPARENMIVCYDHTVGATAAQALEERREWYRRQSPQWAPLRAPHLNDRDPERPLRVGYVSGDFRDHSACYAFSPIVLRHSPAVEVYCYNTSMPTAAESGWDRYTQLYSQETILRGVVQTTTADVCQIIRRDKIDILVDLAAFTNWGRLDIFCAKPAPIQATGWGYCLGTGCDTVDYLFGDPVTTPFSDQEYFVEKLLHLPSVVPYVGPIDAPPVMPMPRLAGHPFTFGLFSSPRKINALTLKLWNRVLKAVPGSRVLMQNSLSHRAEYREFIIAGLPDVSPDRVEFAEHALHHEHLGAFGRVDLGLDCFPNSGGMTALEGLWMGVPHVTLMGPRLTSRVASSIHLLLGMDDFIARSEDEFVDLAVRWATEGIPHLAMWRMRLRSLMFKSPLIQGYPEAVEEVYRTIWREWCKSPVDMAPCDGIASLR